MAANTHPLVLRNVVATFDCGRVINCAEVAIAISGRYDNARFPAVLSYQAETGSSAQLFQTGRVVIVGCRSEGDALVAAYLLCRTLWRTCCLDVGMLSFHVRNVVCSIELGYPVNLDLMSHDLDVREDDAGGGASYTPESFPGMAWSVWDPDSQRTRRATIALFATGRGVATGLKSVNQMAWVNAYLVKTMPPYRTGAEYRELEPDRMRKRDAPLSAAAPKRKARKAHASKLAAEIAVEVTEACEEAMKMYES